MKVVLSTPEGEKPWVDSVVAIQEYHHVKRSYDAFIQFCDLHSESGLTEFNPEELWMFTYIASSRNAHYLKDGRWSKLELLEVSRDVLKVLLEHPHPNRIARAEVRESAAETEARSNQGVLFSESEIEEIDAGVEIPIEAGSKSRNAPLPLSIKGWKEVWRRYINLPL